MAQTVFAPWTDTDQKPLIEFRNVTKSFGDFTAIDIAMGGQRHDPVRIRLSPDEVDRGQAHRASCAKDGNAFHTTHAACASTA